MRLSSRTAESSSAMFRVLVSLEYILRASAAGETGQWIVVIVDIGSLSSYFSVRDPISIIIGLH